MKKNKRVEAPNILRFTDRFNSVCLWCQREILSHEATLKRAEVIGHFIKVAKVSELALSRIFVRGKMITKLK